MGCCYVVGRHVLTHGSQHFVQRDSRETGGVIGQAIGNDQFTFVDESSTGINDVGYVAFPLVLVWCEQGFAKATDYLDRIIEIEKERTDAVLSQGADTVAEDQPAGIGLDGGPAISYLDQLPRESWFKEDLVFIPEVDVVGKHEVDVLVVLAGEHGIAAVDLAGEECHAFVLGGRTVQA